MSSKSLSFGRQSIGLWGADVEAFALRNASRTHARVASGSVIVMVAVVAVVRSGRPTEEAVAGATGLAYYTADDGATGLTDSVNKPSPFQKDGKEMVRAYVCRDADGKEFVSHLERYTAEAQQAPAAVAALPPEQRAMEDPSSASGGPDGIEVKRPKDTTWVRVSDPRAQKIMQPRSPSGKTDGLTFVAPR